MELRSTEKQALEFTNIVARDLPEAWFLCLKACLKSGYTYTIDRGSYEGQKRKELDLVLVKVNFPSTRPIIPDTPPGVPPPSDMGYIERYLPYVMAGTNVRKNNEQYTYGEDIEPQLQKIIRDLKESGFNSNQTCITVGSKESVLLSDPQCLRLIDIRVRYGKVHFIVYFRSWDLWGGFPSNLAAIQLMKEYTALELGVDDGELIGISKGLHLYDTHWEVANRVVNR